MCLCYRHCALLPGLLLAKLICQLVPSEQDNVAVLFFMPLAHSIPLRVCIVTHLR